MLSCGREQLQPPDMALKLDTPDAQQLFIRAVMQPAGPEFVHELGDVATAALPKGADVRG